MTNKAKNKIKNMNFLSQPRTRMMPEKVDLNTKKENYRKKETDEKFQRVTRRVI
tara:strand:- start:767 stop:928 length:162 start_codon:yes stop_codon:yes gene_type:complete